MSWLTPSVDYHLITKGHLGGHAGGNGRKGGIGREKASACKAAGDPEDLGIKEKLHLLLIGDFLEVSGLVRTRCAWEWRYDVRAALTSHIGP